MTDEKNCYDCEKCGTLPDKRELIDFCIKKNSYINPDHAKKFGKNDKSSQNYCIGFSEED